jgi:hypothetical protein
MNDLERLLTRDVERLLDRLAASIPDNAAARIRRSMPTLATRIEDVDARLAVARGALLDAYASWRQALEDAENLWALAAWRAAVADEPPAASARLAA